jgi:excinuclease UvrABC helicase subunit UvrB
LEEFGITSTKKNVKRDKRGREITKLDTLGDARPVLEIIKDKEKQMREAAKNLEFELAAILRDEIHELQKRSRK